MNRLQQLFLQKPPNLNHFMELPVPTEISFISHSPKGKDLDNDRIILSKMHVKNRDSILDHGRMHVYAYDEKNSSGSCGCTLTEAETESDCSSLSNGSSIFFCSDTLPDEIFKQIPENSSSTCKESKIITTIHEQHKYRERHFIDDNKLLESIDSPGRRRREAHPKLLSLQKIINASKRAESPRSRRRELHPSLLV